MRQLLAELAHGLREHVLPQLGSHAGRTHIQAGTGGDVTFAIDEQAETWLERYLAEHAPEVAYYSEDRGLVMPTSKEHPEFPPEEMPAPTALPEFPPEPRELPEFPPKEIPVLLIDPIDGTRPAMAGLESCCVAVAVAPLGDGAPTMGDVTAACVAEIKTGTTFIAERGRGLEITTHDGRPLPDGRSATTELARMFWTLGFRGRPAIPLVTVLSELIDLSSVGGAVFDLGSAAFDLTRIATGQLDAYLDVGTRMIDEVPALRPRFEQVGGGAVLNNSPYDLAAAVLCVVEAGATVTDAYGRSLAARPLLGAGHEYQMSCVAASNAELHARILECLERGFDRLART
jgi:myo-inositol-1(or 4)-monophosphatase